MRCKSFGVNAVPTFESLRAAKHLGGVGGRPVEIKAIKLGGSMEINDLGKTTGCALS